MGDLPMVVGGSQGMSDRFYYSVVTRLARDRVWQLFADITNWHRISGIYDDLKWVGKPWLPGSRIVGEHHDPVAVKFHYVVESCVPPESVRLVAHGTETGFATGRTINLEQLDYGTLMKVDSYTVGEPVIRLPDGVQGFIRNITVRHWNAFACFCDSQAPLPIGDGPVFGHQPIVWNEATDEWFCARCGQTSNCIAWDDAKSELNLSECRLPFFSDPVMCFPPLQGNA
jgi:hypothetical protein